MNRKSSEKTNEEIDVWKKLEDQLAVDFASFSAIITTGLAEFKVRLNELRGTVRTKTFEVVSDDPRLQGWHENLIMAVDYVRSYGYRQSNMPGGVSLQRIISHTAYNVKGRKRRYTNLRKETFKKILDDMRAGIAAYITVGDEQASATALRNDWRAFKYNHMNSMVVPPGLEVKMWTGPEAPTQQTIPRFSIQMHPAHFGALSSLKLREHQVRDILKVINQVMDVDKIFVLVAVRDDKPVFWDGDMWRGYSDRWGFGMVFHARSDAEEAADGEARNRAGVDWSSTIRVEKWAHLFPPYSCIAHACSSL